MTNGNGSKDEGPQSGDVTIHVKGPDKCSACGTPEKLIVEHQDKWVIWRFDQMGVFIFICPFCHGLTANANVTQTVEFTQKQRERRVAPVKSPLIIPPGAIPH